LPKRHIALLPFALLLLSACGAATQAAGITVEQRADEIIAHAAEAEPAVTAMLQELAEEAGGRMYKLEYRLKSRKSALRKLRKILHEHPDRPVAALMINDSFRYTMLVEDDPPGNYVRAIQATFTRLLGEGHEVIEVKNYWPKGDNYSGVNTVLKHPNGLPWELQFHTEASSEWNAKQHSLYEVLRGVDTPVERKREVFDQMKQCWETIPIPAGVLDPANLHPTERIIKRNPP